MTKKPSDTPENKPSDSSAPAAPNAQPSKKKLSLDVSDVSEVLERKISP